ncbi:Intracellular distribution of mitochondria [Cadophora gregata]|uniref:Intracellular distribution of mitochondria n=1 Tax=Cadophora gregata TaxID=51156 RepID=UPI0026DA8DE8|nr:Intracellular distribution of mitochondria [Cadophora gregata]KAK0113164.1 Intracellular distribution of mitochondria [Cadophora gregata]KAK0125206.1 Intracellular distribution of mitochondria [Cadophora gregata f. sp. sojae]
MAENNDAKIVVSEPPAGAAESSNTTTDLDHTTANGEADGEDQVETIFQLTVNLPHAPKKIQIMVSSQEAIHDVRQSVIETPGTFQYSCFHLEHKGQRINDFIQLSEVDDITSDSELTLVEDPYNEKEARLHVVRVRELIGAAGDRTDTLHGVLSGLSLHDSVTASETSTDGAPAHPMTGYKFDAPGVLSNLLPQAHDSAPKTIKSISVSPWNPPPYHLRQKGHLLYIQVTTNEGEQYQITSHVSGFFVNKSSNAKFDPFPRGAPKAHAAHSLLSLLSELSPGFDGSFKKLQEHNNLKEPLGTFQITNATPASPWVVPNSISPLVAHQPDITRTQESYLISGIENTETLRDWNEEFQSTRELPKETVQDRVFRERLTSKLFADYNEAAARGAILVARGEVAPLNPTEGRDAQIFVYNNVFFSFGADGVGTFASEGGDEAARVATGKDVMGVRMVNQLDIEGLFTPGTVVIDYMGKRLVGQSIVPGIFKQRDPGENQIDYGAVDGKEVVASDERFVPAFAKLSKALKVKKHAVWDKAGKRHELEGSVETKGLLGTDGRKYVLDLYRITPLDISWMEEFGTAVGSPEQVNGTSKNAYPHRMTVLRPELVEAYSKSKLREWVNGELEKRRATSPEKSDAKAMESDAGDDAAKSTSEDEKTIATTEEAQDFDKERIDISNFSFSLNPDAFSGQAPETDSDKEELAKDEQDVRHACEFLRGTVLPELISDLKEGDVGFPMDGQSLSRLLHKRGINIRYLGRLAGLAEGKRLECLRALTLQEMISRAFKHIASKYLRYLPTPLTASCIAHLLNCLLGAGLNAKPKADIDESMATLYPEIALDFQKVSPESLQAEIETEILRRYQYAIETSWADNIKPVQLLREVSLKLGLQLELKDYHFTPQPHNGSVESAVNGHAKDNAPNGEKTSKKKKKARDGSPASIASVKISTPHTFVPDDIVNIVPVIKEASPRSSLAEEALEAGRISIMQNQKKLGQDLLLESLSLHEQIYGIIHPEVARVYNTLSMLYYQLEEKEAAVELARKAVIVSERTLGIDNAETLLSYLNLGLFGHANGDTKQALIYIKHALELWKVIYGPNHPDSITTINNAAVMLQHLKEYHESRLWFEASLAVCESVFGKDSINAATLLFQLAQALALDQDPKAAVNRMRQSYNIFLNALGPADKNTKEAESWLEQLTQNAVSIAKHEKDVEARRLRAGIQVSPRVTLGRTRPQPQVGQTAEATTGRDPRKGLDSRSIDELLKFIEGDSKTSTPKKRPGRNTNPKRRGGSSAPVS